MFKDNVKVTGMTNRYWILVSLLVATMLSGVTALWWALDHGGQFGLLAVLLGLTGSFIIGLIEQL